jgi:hypothetical protein
MDDKDLLSAVRDDFSGVRMHIEAGAILTGGDALRRRRNHRRMYAATGACAVAAVSAAALVPGLSATSGTHDAQLTAWTVQKEANGTIDVTIHDLTDLSALEQKLAADGAPAEVVTEKPYPAACVDYPAMKENMSSVITNGPAVPSGYAFVIHPAGIPSGTKLLLDITQLHVTSHGTSGGVGDKLWGFGASNLIGSGVAANMGLVYDTSRC